MENDSQTMDKDLVELVGARAKDKKVPTLIIIYNIVLIISVQSSVRIEAMTTIGTIYDNCYQRIKNNDKLAIEKAGWIPDLIISCLYLGDLSVQ